MEFHEKLQELRKQKNLTQEELSEILFVSRELPFQNGSQGVAIQALTP